MPNERRSIQWQEDPNKTTRSLGGRFQIIKDPASTQTPTMRQYLLQDTISGVEYICPTVRYAKHFAEFIILPYEASKSKEEVANCMQELEKIKSPEEETKSPEETLPDGKHKGFTLTDMAVAMLVFAVLALVGVFCYQRQVTKTRQMDASEHIQGYVAIADTFIQAHKEDCLYGIAGVTAINTYMDEDSFITPQNDAYAPGDVNADGYVTEADAAAAKEMWDNRSNPSLIPEDALRRADVDQDGALTNTDIDLIHKLATGEKKNRIDLAADYLRGYTACLDLWGNPYKVTLIPEAGNVSMEFRSAGRDGVYDTEDDIVDLFQPKYNTGAVRF